MAHSGAHHVRAYMKRILHLGNPEFGTLPQANTLLRYSGVSFPYADQSIDYAFAQLVYADPHPLTTQKHLTPSLSVINELYRTCRSGTLVTRSPAAVALNDTHSENDVMMWTDAHTNVLHVLPVRRPLRVRRREEWAALMYSHPFYQLNVYQWSNSFEFNMQVHREFDDLEAYEDKTEEALEESAGYTRWFNETFMCPPS